MWRFIRECFYFFIAFLIAVSGYAVPLVVLLMSAILPDPEQLIIEHAPEREVGLAMDEGLLDDAFLRDQPGPAPQDPDPGEAKEAPPEPVVQAPVEPDPPKKPVKEPPPEAEQDEKPTDGLVADLPVKEGATPRAKADASALIRAARAERLAAERAAAKKKGGGKGTKKQKCADPTPGVAAIGPNEYSIEREIIMRYANDLDTASRLAYVDWARNDKGKVIGFTVKRIRCGTLLDQAGLQNGDIIHSFNGKEVKSIVNAFAAWRKVRKKEVVRVKITRKGEKIELRYHIE